MNTKPLTKRQEIGKRRYDRLVSLSSGRGTCALPIFHHPASRTESLRITQHELSATT